MSLVTFIRLNQARFVAPSLFLSFLGCFGLLSAELLISLLLILFSLAFPQPDMVGDLTHVVRLNWQDWAGHSSYVKSPFSLFILM